MYLTMSKRGFIPFHPHTKMWKHLSFEKLFKIIKKSFPIYMMNTGTFKTYPPPHLKRWDTRINDFYFFKIYFKRQRFAEFERMKNSVVVFILDIVKHFKLTMKSFLSVNCVLYFPFDRAEKTKRRPTKY